MKNGTLLCPVCKAGLSAGERTLVCPAGHSFDIARSGYVNLLPPGKKSNASTGDPEDMVRARRDFLSRGHYDRYVREAAGIIRGLTDGNICTAIDAACGEGHHTMILADELQPELMLGVDASKKAADAGAKAFRRSETAQIRCGEGNTDADNAILTANDVRRAEVSFIAGNIFSLPVGDKSIDLVTVLFAPVPDREAHRVLRDGAYLAVCSAGEDHLIELRQMIYDEVRIKDCTPPEYDGFVIAERRNIRYKVTLTGDEVRELFTMTPFYHRAKAEAKEKIAAAGETEMTISVNCTVYRKTDNKEN